MSLAGRLNIKRIGNRCAEFLVVCGAVFGALIFLSGCEEIPEKTRGDDELSEFGVEHLELEYDMKAGESRKRGTVHLFKLPEGRFDTVLGYSDVPKLVSEWRENFENSEGDSLFLALNGAYFHEDYSPSGYLNVSGESVGTRVFDLDKSGLIVFGEDVEIHDLEGRGDLLENAGFDAAIQSYPFFIKNGKPAISQDSGLTARRTAIGTDKDGDVYVIYVGEPFLSLYELMEILDESEIDFENVLNLDGGPSSGVSFSGTMQKRFDSLVSVPNAVVFEIRR